MNVIVNQLKWSMVACISLVLCACATSEKDLDFGGSVRSMQNAQIYDKSAALNPVTEPVPQDGQKAQIIIDTFWEVGTQSKEIKLNGLIIGK